MSPFEVVYGVNPIGPLDLLPYLTKKQFSGDASERVKEIKKIHELVRASIEKQNERHVRAANKHRKHVEFNVGDLLVWIHLRKERFPHGKFGKLKPKADGPFKVLKRIGKNAYEMNCPRGMGCHQHLM